MLKVESIYSLRTISLTLNQYGIDNWNIPMGTESFKVYKGTTNPIVLVIRNNDRKPINLAGRNVIVTISDYETEKTYFSKRVNVIDKFNGQALLTLDPNTIAMWPVGFMRYTIMLEEPDGTSQILWVDYNMNAEGHFEVCDGPTLGPIPSQKCDKFTPNYWVDPAHPKVDDYNLRDTWWYTYAFKGNQWSNNFGGIHTAAFYCKNFSGWVMIQGSLENDIPTNNTQWFTIDAYDLRSFFDKNDLHSIQPETSYNYGAIGSSHILDCTDDHNPYLRFNNFTGVSSISFEGSLRWVRFAYIADAFNIGSLDKIMFRN